jgi:hypothetical protein
MRDRSALATSSASASVRNTHTSEISSLDERTVSFTDARITATVVGGHSRTLAQGEELISEGVSRRPYLARFGQALPRRAVVSATENLSPAPRVDGVIRRLQSECKNTFRQSPHSAPVFPAVDGP